MLPGEVRIFVCTEPIDMRYGFDRLAAAVRERVGQDPLAGGLYIFANRGATRVKLLWFDRNGLCILYKRLHRAVFELPLAPAGARSVLLDRAALAALLGGAERPRSLRRTRNRTLH
jgi:transposase